MGFWRNLVSDSFLRYIPYDIEFKMQYMQRIFKISLKDGLLMV